MHRVNPEPKRDPNRIRVEATPGAGGLGYSPALRDASMGRAPSVRDKNRKARKQARRDCRDIEG